MTDTPTTTARPVTATTPSARLGVAGSHVGRVIARLRSGTAGPAAAAALAQLRRGVGREPGSVPEVWPWTMDGLETTAVDDRASVEEVAVHHALTLYAYHQQSRSASMHERGTGFGRAVRRLAEVGRGEQPIQDGPVYRRLTAMTTAAHLDEVVVHARGLIGQLRAADIPFDYARFADDLRGLQVRSLAVGVRRRWSRDFFARTTPADATQDSPSPSREGDLA